jgi:hypothetical protein
LLHGLGDHVLAQPGPAVSSVAVATRIRPCALDPSPLEEVSTWAERYRPVWEARFDRMDDYLKQLQPRRRAGIGDD